MPVTSKELLSCVPHGLKKRIAVCGPRWARILSPLEAAVYAGYSTLNAFRKSPYGPLLRFGDGREYVDRDALDAALTHDLEGAE